ncbi:hypothetical protein WDU94_012608 [Cyamophila willieti]
MGNTDSLFSLMEARDPTLLVWKLYLRAVCAHCERNSLLNSLYAIQLRTRDHVRAAITCVLFYLKDVHTYVQLNEKSYHLINARAHLKDYRTEKTSKTAILIIATYLYCQLPITILFTILGQTKIIFR